MRCGNILRKTVGDTLTEFAYDRANQLVQSKVINPGNPEILPKTTDFAYDEDKLATSHSSLATKGNDTDSTFFTGKPFVPELGHAFLLRNYRSDLGKWQTADPLGYPDGLNNFAYVNGCVTSAVDWLGAETVYDRTVEIPAQFFDFADWVNGATGYSLIAGESLWFYGYIVVSGVGSGTTLADAKITGEKVAVYVSGGFQVLHVYQIPTYDEYGNEEGFEIKNDIINVTFSGTGTLDLDETDIVQGSLVKQYKVTLDITASGGGKAHPFQLPLKDNATLKYTPKE